MDDVKPTPKQLKAAWVSHVDRVLLDAIITIRSLSDNEPLDGDEVREVSKMFVESLCSCNGEEDQINQILKGETNGL